MDYVEVPLFGKYSHLKCKLDKDWYQMICVDGGYNLTKFNNYAAINCYYKGKDYKTLVHQLIMDNCGYPKTNKFLVDHINGDGLDNTRVNLQVVSPSENHRNRNNRISRRSISGVRGLSIFSKGNTKYQVCLTENCKYLYRKRFSNYEDAKAIAEFHNLIRDL